MDAPTPIFSAWLLALVAAMEARGEAVDMAKLTQRDLDDLAHRYRLGDTPEQCASVLRGEARVPRPWVTGDGGGEAA